MTTRRGHDMPHNGRTRERGQVLPLFALMLVVILGMAALAIDVSRKYADIRFERRAGDAASLAGAQDLQVPGMQTVTTVEQTNARTLALETLKNQLGATGVGTGLCDPAGNLVDCELTGTPYFVSIKTPAVSCTHGGTSTCDPLHSVQVSVRNKTFQTSFARVLGQTTWDVAATSVAGLDFGKSYAIITLRPPKKSGSTFIINDIDIDGGSVVNVKQGDVGTNSNMEYSGTGSILNLDPGYNMYYYPGDPPAGPQWGSNPVGTTLGTLIKDPPYRYPMMSNVATGIAAPTYDDARTSQYATLDAVDRADTDPSCAAEVAKVPAAYGFMATQAPNTIYCFNPGIYESGSGAKDATITIGTGEVGLLKPGAYYLKSGMDISGRIIGGYEVAKPGVALMFDEAGPGNCSSCIFDGNNALTIALNAGSNFPPSASYIPANAATAALDWDNQKVETSGPSSPVPHLVMTLLVNKDPDCVVPTSAPFLEPSACDANKNKTLNIAGGGSLALEGVQYAPTDNVEIHGGSAGDGQVGQIISWTLFYSGGTHINQFGPSSIGNGILRIDPACSAPGEPCVDPF